jgi:hypothetical protein
MHSADGPRMAAGDVNGDKLQDFYICGAAGQPGALYTQTRDGRFKKSNEGLFEKDKGSEDTDCLFFDADGTATRTCTFAAAAASSRPTPQS